MIDPADLAAIAEAALAEPIVSTLIGTIRVPVAPGLVLELLYDASRACGRQDPGGIHVRPQRNALEAARQEHGGRAPRPAGRTGSS